MTAYIQSQEWITPSFPIAQGVFQCDTLSPVIFLLAFSPITHLAETWKYAGFFNQIPIPNSEGLPPIDQSIYVRWDKDDPETVDSHCNTYVVPQKWLTFPIPSGDLPERTAISSSHHTNHPRLNPRMQPQNKAPSTSKELSTSGKALLTTSPSDVKEHQQRIESTARYLGLSLNPTKCVSLTLANGKVIPDCSIPLLNGSTRSILDHPTKFLGQVVTAYPLLTKREASKCLQQKVETALKHTNERPIRGEMKMWIVSHYLLPSLHFHLQVNPISSTLLKLEQTIRTLLKKWLKLPLNATQAILYHPSVLAVHAVSSCCTKAKVSYMSSILASSDTAIIELNHLIDSPAFLKRQEIPTEATTCLRTSQSSTPTSLKVLKRKQ